MKIPQLRMVSQMAQIEINQTNAKLEIRQELPKVHLEQRPAEVSIRTIPGKLTIDQTKAFEDMNLMSIMKRNDQHAREALQDLQTGIARKAREGKELMQIEHGGNPIAQQAKQKGFSSMKSLGIKFIPSHFAVKTDYEPADVDIQVTTHKPKVQAETYPPTITYHPGSVETSLAQKNDLDISVVKP